MTGTAPVAPSRVLLLLAAATLPAAAATLVPARMPATPQPVVVAVLATAPQVDGDLGDWAADGWSKVAVRPAVENDDQNRVGAIEVDLRAGVHDGRFYLAARWPDVRADTEFKPWEWDGNRYRRGRRLDDMFAVRFDLDGDYNSCMIAAADYRVDVWQWSAGRSDPTGYADDGWQLITTRFLDHAAEYTGPSDKTIYIRKSRDMGVAGYVTAKPERKTFQGEKLPGIDWTGAPAGSAADVTAKGTWVDGHWQVEMSRALATGHDDDAVLPPGAIRVGAIAVFDRQGAEHKSVSGDLHFDFGALR